MAPTWLRRWSRVVKDLISEILLEASDGRGTGTIKFLLVIITPFHAELLLTCKLKSRFPLQFLVRPSLINYHTRRIWAPHKCIQITHLLGANNQAGRMIFMLSYRVDAVFKVEHLQQLPNNLSPICMYWVAQYHLLLILGGVAATVL
jgi:hypothetical protein